MTSLRYREFPVVEFTQRGHFIKICGVTSVQDAVLVGDAGADAVGINFATSKRHVDVDQAREIALASEGLIRVGVFRDNDPEFVLEAASTTGIDVVQIHGLLDDTLLEQLRRRGLGVIKALSVGTEEFSSFDDATVDAVLVDGIEPGSGVEHSWDDLGTRTFVAPLIAAGGLSSENVAAIIEQVRPWGVDVATGVETEPRRKDFDRMTTFVKLAQSAYDESGTG